MIRREKTIVKVKVKFSHLSTLATWKFAGFSEKRDDFETKHIGIKFVEFCATLLLLGKTMKICVKMTKNYSQSKFIRAQFRKWIESSVLRYLLNFWASRLGNLFVSVTSWFDLLTTQSKRKAKTRKLEKSRFQLFLIYFSVKNTLYDPRKPQ